MLVIAPFPYAGWALYLDGVRGEVLCSAPRLPRISNQHYTFSVLGCQKDNAGGFEGTAHLIACIVANLEPVGLQALQRGQGHQGLVGEHVLRPPKKRTRSPHLARRDHS